jgi:hypothetical protein
MYTSPRIQRFVERCESQALPWAILSAKYGLFFPNERKPTYDVTLNRRQQNIGYFLNIRVVKEKKSLGREESKNHIATLAQNIQDRLEQRRVDKVIFWFEGRRPDAYIALLHYASDRCDSIPPGQTNLEPHLQTCARTGRMKLTKNLHMIE